VKRNEIDGHRSPGTAGYPWLMRRPRNPHWLLKGSRPLPFKRGLPPPWPSGMVLLTAPVRNVAAVMVEQVPYHRPDGSIETVRIVSFAADRIFTDIIRELRQSVVSDGETGQVRVVNQDRARLLGRLLYAKLRPDVGTGRRFGSLGMRRISTALIMKRVADDRDMSAAEIRKVLRQDGAAMLGQRESFEEIKRRCNFPFEDDLAEGDDIAIANAFLDGVGAEIACEEHRFSIGRPKLGAWPSTKDGRVPEAMYNNLRISIRSMLGQAGHQHGDAVDRAATLVSHHDRVLADVRAAEGILASIPEGILTDFDKRVFGYMWLAKPGLDKRGRCDRPLMSTPSLVGLVTGMCDAHTKLVIKRGRTKDHQKLKILRSGFDDLMWFIETGTPNPTLEYLVGQTTYYPDMLQAERRMDRERNRPAPPGPA